MVNVALLGNSYHHTLGETEFFAGSLLFSMGMQNALVSMISGSVVRTTHLTGMFTDLGIDLATALLSYKKISIQIRKRIILRSAIIIFFLIGCLLGGIIFQKSSFKAFYIPVGILVTGLLYDNFRIRARRILRKKSILR